MNKNHFDTLTKHKGMIENYPNLRSIKDQSSAEVTELALVHKDLVGKEPNLLCSACIDEMFMDLHNYYNRLKDEAAKTKKPETEKASSKK